MENVLDIKEILDHLNNKERKAARKFFTLHYRNTKELQLLKMIEAIEPGIRNNIEFKIRKLGYDSMHSKSFLKLKSRLKDKLLDYLSSSFSINEFKNIDDNSYLKHKLKKMMLQSGILIEKGLHFQAGEIARNTLRLAKEYEQMDMIVEALNKLKQLSKLNGKHDELISLIEESRRYEDIQHQFSEIETRFNLLIDHIDLHGNLDFEQLFTSFAFRYRAQYEEFEVLNSLFNFVQVLKLKMHGRFHKAFSLNADIIRRVKKSPMKFEIKHKALFLRMHLQLMRSCRHAELANSIRMKLMKNSLPLQQKFYLDHDDFIFSFNTESELKLNPPRNISLGDNIHQLLIYDRCLYLFNAGQFKKCNELIAEKIRAYSLSSTQQLDLMILEMMCHYELSHDDLLEYRVQSYVKNLAYRSKYEIPLYYHKMHRLIRLLLRSEAGRFEDKLDALLHEVKECKVDGLQESRSVFPNLMLRWIKEKVELIDLMKSHEIENCNPAFLTRVA